MTTQTWYGSVTELRPIEDTRGRLFEILRFAPGDKHGQAYITTCRHGIVKAWHHHEKQTDRMVCVYGTLQIGLWHEGTDKTETIVSSTISPRLVTIRPGIWHGFSSIGGTEAIVLNIPDRAYDPADPDEQRRPAHDPGIPYFWGPRDGSGLTAGPAHTMDLRAFVFGLWVKGGESVTTLVTLLKTAASDQSSLITDGGRVILSSSVNGKSFSYSFAPGMSPMQVQSMSYEAWRRVKDFNATDLDAFLTYEMPRVAYAQFGQRAGAETAT